MLTLGSGTLQVAGIDSVRGVETFRLRFRLQGKTVFYSLDDQHIMSIFKQTLQHVEEERRPSAFARASSFARATADRPEDQPPFGGCQQGEGVRWDTEKVLAGTLFKCSACETPRSISTEPRSLP